MVTVYGLPVGSLGAVKVPGKVEVDGPLGVSGKGPVVTPFTCTVRGEMSPGVSSCTAAELDLTAQSPLALEYKQSECGRQRELCMSAKVTEQEKELTLCTVLLVCSTRISKGADREGD